MLTRPSRARDDEQGVTLVLVALLMTAMLTVVALVVDLGYVRGSARADQSIADLAALAGSEHLENERYVDACEDMIEYLNINAKGMPAIDATGFCAPMGTTYCTNGLLPQSAVVAPTTTSGKYTVTIAFPVPDEVGPFPAIGAGAADGIPCDRMRVTVTSAEPALFGGVVGTSEYQATRSATLRAGPGDEFKAPALWLLEPRGCDVLRTTGSASVIVGDLLATPPVEGLITVDSDGTQMNGSGNCGGNAVTISAGGGKIMALPNSSTPGPYTEWGEIRTPSMPRWAASCTGTKACVQAHVDDGNLLPMPTHVPQRSTRAPVDWEWNCKSAYGDYSVTSGSVQIPGCDAAGERGAYIDKLREAVGGTGSLTGSGFSTYPVAGNPAHSCSVSGHVVLPTGNWFVECNNLRVSGGNSITFSGGNVVTRGSVVTTGDGIVRFNYAGEAQGTMCEPAPGLPMCMGSTAEAAWVYVRSGDLDFSGSLVAKHTMIYLDHETSGGIIKLSGQAELDWTAPREGPFKGLAAWAEERSGNYAVGGGGTVTMAGAFFTPYANEIKVGGGGSWDVENAQFISQRINFVGNATLAMAPDPVEALPLPPREGFLIR